MGLEVVTFVNDLVITNPLSTDKKKQGDDHLRAIKTAVKGSFPTSTKAWYNPDTVAKTASYSVLAADMNKTILVDTTAGAVTLTMPALASGDAGWECSVIKTNVGTNPCFIAPPSGTIQSGDILGLTKTRRCVPGVKSRVMWAGSAWIAERAIHVPVGSVIDFCGASLPVGYEWPNGQTLGSASANYPDFYSANASSGVVLDLCGRVVAGKDDMGEVSNNRLTTAGSGIDGDVLGAAGGLETHALTEAQMPVHVHSITDPGHRHFVVAGGSAVTLSAANQMLSNFQNGQPNAYELFGSATDATLSRSSSASTGITASNSAGSGTAHNNVQPTIVMNKILVVE